ncbi:MAG: GPR1/FUN34/YaaH family transporter [Treponemataceae bacterium]|nr:MAG: GPR1/FUN34/YaaH family transporter [Treponemataceae bacterium]
MSSEIGKKANPGPLGLAGFGMTTVLLNLHNAQIIEFSIIIVAMGLCLGGLAQIIAGITEFKVGNTFGGVAFTAYGTFWWSFCLIKINPFKEVIGGADEMGLVFYLILWGLFTFGMFLGTLAHNWITRIVFFSLTVLFFLLAAGDFFHSHDITKIAGYVGVFCGLSAIYSSLGQVVNGEFAKKVFPM